MLDIFGSNFARLALVFSLEEDKFCLSWVGLSYYFNFDTILVVVTLILDEVEAFIGVIFLEVWHRVYS